MQGLCRLSIIMIVSPALLHVHFYGFCAPQVESLGHCGPVVGFLWQFFLVVIGSDKFTEKCAPSDSLCSVV